MNIPDPIRLHIRPKCQICDPATTGTKFAARKHCDHRGCGLMMCEAHAVSGTAGDGCPAHHVEMGIVPFAAPGIVVEWSRKAPSLRRNGPLAQERNRDAESSLVRGAALEGQLDTL